MLQTVEGLYRNGQIELTEVPRDVGDDARVLVTFLPAGTVDLKSRGINEARAVELRGRLATFAQDWESTEMTDYDDYETNRRKRAFTV